MHVYRYNEAAVYTVELMFNASYVWQSFRDCTLRTLLHTGSPTSFMQFLRRNTNKAFAIVMVEMCATISWGQAVLPILRRLSASLSVRLHNIWRFH